MDSIKLRLMLPAHAGWLSKSIYQKLMIIDSHVTAGGSKERACLGRSVKYRLLAMTTVTAETTPCKKGIYIPPSIVETV